MAPSPAQPGTFQPYENAPPQRHWPVVSLFGDGSFLLHAPCYQVQFLVNSDALYYSYLSIDTARAGSARSYLLSLPPAVLKTPTKPLSDQ
jgi:hypothetical protein